MEFPELMKAVVSKGAWAVLAVYLIKYVIDDKAKTVELLDNNYKDISAAINSDKEKLMEIVVSQRDLLSQQKEILARQTDMLCNNEEILNGLKLSIDKIVDIQLLHANRLEKIEDRVERIERQTLK